MNTKEEILLEVGNRLGTETISMEELMKLGDDVKLFTTAMQEYADQECAEKDNEISRLNGIITEQQRLSNLVSGDLQNAKKEIQELREGGKALILELNDEVIRLRAEVERLKAEIARRDQPENFHCNPG